jgi:lysozyme
MKKTALFTLSILLSAFVFFSSCSESNPGKEDSVPVPNQNQSEIVNWYGLDISQAQTNMLSSIALPDSFHFVICKATEGETYTDPNFATNIKLIKDSNLISGAYHFYHTADLPAVQAQFFWNTIKNTPPDIAPIVDIECLSFCEGSSQCNTPGCITPPNDSIQADLLVFLQELSTLCQCTPMVYASTDFIPSYLNNVQLANYPLWMADYSAIESPAPAPWKDVKIWQKSGSYMLSGYEVDLDLYTGTPAALTQRKVQVGKE